MSPQPQPRSNAKQAAHDQHVYIPPHVEAAMAKQMQQSMPAHLKKYVGPYMQQNVVNPSVGTVRSTPHSTPQAPAPLLHRSGHFPGAQAGAQDRGQRPQFAPDPVLQQSQPTTAQPTRAEHVSPEQAFDFIINPETPVRKPLLPGFSSMALRAAAVSGGLLVFLILFVVIKGFITGSSPLPGFVSVVQDQQELLHLIASTDGQHDLTTANQNFVATAQLSLDSSQSDLISYLAKNGNKVDKKQVNLKISQTTDTQLANSTSAGTYNQTFKEVMKSKLNAYSQDLQQTYQQTKGEKGKALLSSQYDQAKLLLIQLEDTKS
jgi:hypothetical protein